MAGIQQFSYKSQWGTVCTWGRRSVNSAIYQCSERGNHGCILAECVAYHHWQTRRGKSHTRCPNLGVWTLLSSSQWEKSWGLSSWFLCWPNEMKGCSHLKGRWWLCWSTSAHTLWWSSSRGSKWQHTTALPGSWQHLHRSHDLWNTSLSCCNSWNLGIWASQLRWLIREVGLEGVAFWSLSPWEAHEAIVKWRKLKHTCLMGCWRRVSWSLRLVIGFRQL